MRRIRLSAGACLLAALALTGCFEGNEEALDAGVFDAAPPVTCEEGATQPCFVDGECAGTQTCSGGEFGACVPPEERCDGIDNDCDGTSDEGYDGLGDPCEAGDGACIDRGAIVCAADGAGTVCDATPGDGTTEVCDGVDNDCDGEIDDDVPTGAECDTGREGVCAAGTTACADGDTVCEPTTEAADETCDGLDNDCDGRVDEDGVGGLLAEPCYDGPEGTDGTGICAAGVRLCVDGMFGACEGQVTPGEEICDGVDNDCDGEADGEQCACIAGESQPCYSGADGTAGVGACRAGTQTCLEDGTGFGACAGETVPGVELCDGADNDCDGETDEVAGVGEVCSAGQGACRADGVRACDLATGQVVCDAVAGLPADETCDGLDNDCDGIVDDIDGIGEPCEEGAGACLARGVFACDVQSGALACTATAGRPGVESCNAIDDDCDGAIDEVPGVGEPCAVGTGICRSTATTRCDIELGAVVCPATEQPAEPGEYCQNGQDDDCDGEVDEGECTRPCDTDEDCRPGTLCEGNECVPGDCRDDGDCGEDELCIERVARGIPVGPIARFCQPGNCRGDDDCADGRLCDAFFCIDRPAVCLDPGIIDEFGSYAGDTTGAPSEVVASCAGGARSPENAWQLQLEHQGTICIDTFGSTYDTALFVRTDCVRSGTEIACNDDAAPGFLQSQIELEYDPAADYTVFVDGFSGFGGPNSGAYTLRVRAGACGACASDDDCVPNDRCANITNVCVPDACGDGVRDFGEGCDDGGNEDGDGCSARCTVEDGYACVSPDGLPEVELPFDGRVNCGGPAAAALVEVAPWPVYRAFVNEGAIRVTGGDRWQTQASIAVNGVEAVRIPFVGEGRTPEEAYALLRGIATPVFEVPEGATVGAYFRDANCGDNAGTMSMRIQPVDLCYSTACLADEDCAFGQICVDGTCTDPIDSDGDGVDDLRDIDDDNDGIPDAAECFGALDGQLRLINGGFEEPAVGAGAVQQIPEATVPGWETTEGPGAIEVWGSGFNGVPAAVGNAFAEINAFEATGALYQDIATVPGTRFTWSFYHRGRLGEDTLVLRAGAPDATVALIEATTGNAAWRRYTGSYVVPAGQNLTRFEFRSISSTGGAGLGNFIDGVEFLPECPADADEDGDGIPNSLDLDADGDGILDADEAGHDLPHTDGRVDGPVGGNGLVDEAETVPDSGTIDYVIRDSDGDGTPDFLQVGPFACSNGMIDDDEECDDGNRDDGDGCSVDCLVEPNWMCSEGEPGLGPCRDDQPVETVTLQPGDFLPITGGAGGGPFDDPCAPGEVVTGFVMSIDSAWGRGQTFVQASRAQCAALDVVDGEVRLTPTGLTPIRGEYNPNQPVSCPPGAVVAGYIGYQAPRDDGVFPGTFASAFGLVCGTPRIDGNRFVVEDLVDTPVVGDQRDFVGRFVCPEGSLVGANAGRSGGIVDQLTVRCDGFEEACQSDGSSVCEFVGECLVDADCADGALCRGEECVVIGMCPDDDGFEPNDAIDAAVGVDAGLYEGLAVCGDDDFYAIDVCAGGAVTVDLYFVDDDGDIDLAQVPAGPSSTSVSDDERIVIVNGDADATVTWRVYGFNGAQNAYAMQVTVDGCEDIAPICPDGIEPGDCPDGFTATPDGRSCERLEQVPAQANGALLNVCRAPTNPAYGPNGARLPGGQLIAGGFIGAGGNDSRLNQVGIWACGPGGVAGADPVGELIGFSTCFDLPAAGDYVIGIAGDNGVRAQIDGAVVFDSPVNDFMVWHLVPRTLSAGTHIITLEGSNAGGPAAFGAEIYGPFPAGSLVDDASMMGLPYAESVVFSTLDEVGRTFQTGTTSGFGCPEGTAFDTCGGGEPVCTRFERLDRCALGAIFCGNGAVDEGEACDDGNDASGDGCSAECVVEPAFICEEVGFGIGVTDQVGNEALPDWITSPDGFTVTQRANSRPTTYSTSLPISPNYRATMRIAVNTVNDDDQIGWTIGANDTPLSAPDAPYLLFSWKQGEQNDPVYGLSTVGLRVGLVDGPVTDIEVWQFNGPIMRIADGNRFGAVGWEDNRTYTVEIIGDADGMQVYVDGELEFDLEGPLPTGNLGFFTYSQDQYTAELVSPRSIQVCREVLGETCDNGVDDDDDGAVDCNDRDCNLDPACAITRTVYFTSPIQSGGIGDVPSAPTRLYTLDGAGALQLLGDILRDGVPIAVTASSLSPDGILYGFEYRTAPVGSRLIEIDPDTATAVPVGDWIDILVDGAGHDPEGTLWITDATNRQVRLYVDGEIGPAVIPYPEPFLGSDIAFDSAGNCYLTGVGPNFTQLQFWSCDVAAGTTELIGPIANGPGFDNGNATIPAMAFSLDEETCTERLYALDSVSIDELGYIDLSGDQPRMTHIASTGINFSYYTTPDMAGFPNTTANPACAGRLP